MKKMVLLSVVLLIVVVLAVFVYPVAKEKIQGMTSTTLSYYPGVVIIVFNDGVTVEQKKEFIESHNFTIMSKSRKPPFEDTTYLIKVPENKTESRFLDELHKEKLIASAGLNKILQATGD